MAKAKGMTVEMFVYTDGEHLFVAPTHVKAKEMFVTAFGGDKVGDYGGRIWRLRPRQICTILDDDGETECRFQSRTVARLYPGQTILARG